MERREIALEQFCHFLWSFWIGNTGLRLPSPTLVWLQLEGSTQNDASTWGRTRDTAPCSTLLPFLAGCQGNLMKQHRHTHRTP
jgi:hypothetical protein